MVKLMLWAALLVDVIIFQLIATVIMTTTCNYIAIRGVVSVGDIVTCSFKCNYHRQGGPRRRLEEEEQLQSNPSYS